MSAECSAYFRSCWCGWFTCLVVCSISLHPWAFHSSLAVLTCVPGVLVDICEHPSVCSLHQTYWDLGCGFVLVFLLRFLHPDFLSDSYTHAVYDSYSCSVHISNRCLKLSFMELWGTLDCFWLNFVWSRIIACDSFGDVNPFILLLQSQTVRLNNGPNVPFLWHLSKN